MPFINFDDVKENEGFEPLPDGTYGCQCVQVDMSKSNDGDEKWNLRWKVLDGEYAGRIIFDSLTFSKKGMSRVKLVCARAGAPAEGSVDLKTSHLLNKYAAVTVFANSYFDKDDHEKKNNKVPFDGYDHWAPGSKVGAPLQKGVTPRAVAPAKATAGSDMSEDSLPF